MFKIKDKSHWENLLKSHKYKHVYDLPDGVKAKDIVNVYCPEHDCHYKIQLQIAAYGGSTGCRKCLNGRCNRSRTRDEWVEHINKPHYKITFPEGKVYAKTRVEVKCSKHDKKFSAILYDLATEKTFCPKCKAIKNARPKEEWVKKFRKIHGNKYRYLNDIITFNEPLEMYCKEHDEYFSQHVSNHLAGKITCKGCRDWGRSKGEKEMLEFVKSLDSTTTYSYRDKFEIDIFIERLNLGFEYSGAFWHSADKKGKNYHQDKYKYFKNLGIELVQFWEHEWRDKQDIVKSIIRNKLGLTERKIYARKCNVISLSSKESNKFLAENHIQGSAGASVRLGLMHNKELVSILTFGKPRFNKGFDFEVIRSCNELNTVVVGGLSKLWKHFVKNYKPKSVVTYADARLFNGESYKSLGFEFSELTRPNYFYFKNGNIFSRIKFQKHKLEKLLDIFDSDLSEKENMIVNKYQIIYDAGNMRFEYGQ